MDSTESFQLSPIGHVRSVLKERADAPRQGCEGAPQADLEISPAFSIALEGLQAGDHLWVLTWLHQSQRSILKVHPRDDVNSPEKGVFATRSADRPNPIGMHLVSVLAIDGNRLTVRPLEAIDGTRSLTSNRFLSQSICCEDASLPCMTCERHITLDP